MKRNINWAIAIILTITNINAQDFKTVCGELYKEEKEYLECWLEVGSRRPSIYILENIQCEFMSEGQRYCASGWVEKGYDGNFQMRTVFYEEESHP